MITLCLPWPPRLLWPNRDGANRYARSSAKKTYRAACEAATLAQNPDRWSPEERPNAPHLSIAFHGFPPDRYAYDTVNLPAALKAGVDGMCDAFGFDDVLFTGVGCRLHEVIRGGQVDVRIMSDVERQFPRDPITPPWQRPIAKPRSRPRREPGSDG